MAAPTQTGRFGDYTQTFTGVKFYPLDPRPEEVCVEDIAHHLALVCRFGGAVREPYSVAQHSCLVADYVGTVETTDRQVRLAALLHDATEAYCGDMVRPLKRNMTEYKAAEERIAVAIARRFGLPVTTCSCPHDWPAAHHVNTCIGDDPRWVMPASVKRGDNIILATEARDLMGKCGREWGFVAEPLLGRIRPWTWRRARLEFLTRFDDLGGIR